MLRLTVSPEEYLMINDNIKIVFLGGTKNHLRIMIDAPKEVNIVRSTVLENQITDPEERAKLPKYYAEEDHPEKYRKKSNVIITKGGTKGTVEFLVPYEEASAMYVDDDRKNLSVPSPGTVDIQTMGRNMLLIIENIRL